MTVPFQALIDDEPVSKLSSFASQSFINNRQNKKVGTNKYICLKCYYH